MATKVYANGTATVAVAAGEKIAVSASNTPALVYQQVGYPNYPTTWNLLATVSDAEYLSAAFTSATNIRIDAGANGALYQTGAAPQIAQPISDITGIEDPLNINGLAAAQGGAVTTTGGTSSTATNAGGAVSMIGGTPGATGVGGAAAVTGGAGGSTSGTGGAATVTGGAGTAGNAVGGAATVRGGAANGTGTGGAASVIGGASGAGATGNGGAVAITGGAAASTNGNGGSVTITGGALAGTGLAGIVKIQSVQARALARATVASGGTATAANVVSGILFQDASGGAVTMTLDSAANLNAAFPDMAVGDSIDIYMSSNHATNTSTLGVPASVTLVGSGAVTQTGGQLKLIKTAATPTFDLVRVG